MLAQQKNRPGDRNEPGRQMIAARIFGRDPRTEFSKPRSPELQRQNKWKSPMPACGLVAGQASVGLV
jgi:hypothetical protein